MLPTWDRFVFNLKQSPDGSFQTETVISPLAYFFFYFYLEQKKTF